MLISKYYRDPNGFEPVKNYVYQLDRKTRAKIYQHIERLNKFGQDLDYPYTSQADGELRELRAWVGSRHFRIYYRRSGQFAVLLHIIEKRGGKLPPTDTAMTILSDQLASNVRRKRPVSALGTTVTDDIRAQMADPEFRRATAEYAVAEEVARVLIRFRHDRRLTQKDAAIELGMTESMVCRLERGDHVPNVKTMLRVAEATGTVLSLRFVKPK